MVGAIGGSTQVQAPKIQPQQQAQESGGIDPKQAFALGVEFGKQQPKSGTQGIGQQQEQQSPFASTGLTGKPKGTGGEDATGGNLFNPNALQTVG